MKIYVVIPNINVSGGIKVACEWVRLLREKGYDSVVVTPFGDPSPPWLNYSVPAIGYDSVEDHGENKVVYIWLDQLDQFRMQKSQRYLFMQDVAQPQYVELFPGRFESGFLPLMKACRLITIGAHSHNYYLYRFGIDSRVVNNWVDTELFCPGHKETKSVCLIQHRDHFNPEIPPLLTAAGYTVRIAQGTQAEVAKVMGESDVFISDVRGRFDGFGYSEGFPMPIAEAMAAGCAVLCRDTGGVREYVLDGVNGLFYKDIAEIPVLLDRLVSHWQFDTAARWTMVSKFTRENAWNQIREALELT